MTTIAVIGAGHIGSNVAEAAAKAGYDVIVSNATGPESLDRLASQLGSGSSPVLPAVAPESWTGPPAVDGPRTQQIGKRKAGRS